MGRSPGRLIYLTSGLEANGRARLDDPQWRTRQWDGMQAYSDSKLYDVMLAFAVARLRPDTLSNAVDPGWIRTRMGGPNTTDDLPQGAETQIWLATSDEPAATVTGHYFKRRTALTANPDPISRPGRSSGAWAAVILGAARGRRALSAAPNRLGGALPGAEHRSPLIETPAWRGHPFASGVA